MKEFSPMRILFACSILLSLSALSVEPPLQSQPLYVGSELWLSTVTAPFDANNAEETYKVYTHLMGFEDKQPITKGAGGKYTHHRGLFLGWSKTKVSDTSYDTWSMKNSFQQHLNWEEIQMGEDKSSQVEMIRWYGWDEKTKKVGPALVTEHRIIRASRGGEGLRYIDLTSYLDREGGDTQFRGDLQHAGVHLRMDNEVSEHEDTTQYILPDGAEELDDDKVVGAWWVCASVVVREKRIWIMHMTPPNHPSGVPVYSIRRYGRFGAFWEPDLKPEGIKLVFRIALSKNELDQAACQALYDAYAELNR
jgi:hypothetical protein